MSFTSSTESSRGITTWSTPSSFRTMGRAAGKLTLARVERWISPVNPASRARGITPRSWRIRASGPTWRTREESIWDAAFVSPGLSMVFTVMKSLVPCLRASSPRTASSSTEKLTAAIRAEKLLSPQ